MYVLSPFPNLLYALDLTRPGAPMKWRHDRAPDPASQGVACCDTVNRGPVFAEGRIHYVTLDSQAIAMDARTGAELWKVRLGEISKGETMTMAPLVVNGKVIVGNSGGEMGVRGWIQALDAATGGTVWKACSTGPDRDVLIGPRFRPFHDSDKGTDLGVTSWPPNAWEQGGGTVWGLAASFSGSSFPGMPWPAGRVWRPVTLGNFFTALAFHGLAGPARARRGAEGGGPVSGGARPADSAADPSCTGDPASPPPHRPEGKVSASSGSAWMPGSASPPWPVGVRAVLRSNQTQASNWRGRSACM